MLFNKVGQGNTDRMVSSVYIIERMVGRRVTFLLFIIRNASLANRNKQITSPVEL